MSNLRRSFIKLLLTTTACGLAASCVTTREIRYSAWQLRLDEHAIELQLLVKTPSGTSQAQVLEYLGTYDVKPSILWQGKIPADSSYPPTSVGGDGYVRVLMGEYGLIFVTSVEAFYIFGSNGRLVDVKVRKSTDTL
jgi:hypothetical protein